MKKIFFSFLLFVQLLTAAQNKFPVSVIPGYTFGNLMLGMTEEEVKKIWPYQYTEHDYLQKMREFKNMGSGFAIDSLVEFVLGFDKMWTAADSANSFSPVYNLGFKDGKLNYIGVTSHINNESLVMDLLIDQHIRFYQSPEEGMNWFGKDFLSINYKEYIDHIYYKLGLELLYDEGRLTCFVLFSPTPDYLDRIKTRHKQVLADFEKLEPIISLPIIKK